MKCIATGDNFYFTFSKSKALEYGIENKYLLPCICKSVDVKNSFFSKNDFLELEFNDKTIYLLNAKNQIDDKVKHYIVKGEENQVNKKYLTASRNPWYSLENRHKS